MSLDITPAEAGLVSPECEPAVQALPTRTLAVMAAACGAAAANIYYNQPLLSDFARYFHASENRAGLVATAAQVGYGIGLFFFVPLGDLLERRRIVLTLVFVCSLLLVGTAFAPTLPALIVLQLLVGITAMSAQVLIPLGIDLTPPERRGHTVGILMAGLLCGILLARTVGGVVSDHFGWRAMFGLAAGVMAVLGVVLHFELPHRPPSLRMSYGALMRSMIHLLRTQPPLWIAGAVSGLSFGVFTLFWTALSFLMAEHFHRGASEAGLFGIIGVIGALAAPLAGKLSDKRGSAFTVTLSLACCLIAFGAMWVWVTIAGLIVGVLLMDLGVQSIQVAEQAKVMALVPEARSRINTLYMVARFAGGAAGSAIGTAAWTFARWPGVCGAAVAMTLIALVVHEIGERVTRPRPT
jgi:predicted MFS family arabinose efflux permease